MYKGYINIKKINFFLKHSFTNLSISPLHQGYKMDFEIIIFIPR
jgi:hypothetical protein